MRRWRRRLKQAEARLFQANGAWLREARAARGTAAAQPIGWRASRPVEAATSETARDVERLRAVVIRQIDGEPLGR